MVWLAFPRAHVSLLDSVLSNSFRKIVSDNVAFARVVLTVGFRPNFSKSSLSNILPEEVEAEVKEAAEISMGTEVLTPSSLVCSLSDQRSRLAQHPPSR